MKESTKAKPLGDLPFEEALEKLEEVVAQMEGGNLSLNDMIKAYEKGQILSSACAAKLKAVEKKIEILREKNSGKSWEDFTVGMEKAQSEAEDEPENEPGAKDSLF